MSSRDIHTLWTNGLRRLDERVEVTSLDLRGFSPEAATEELQSLRLRVQIGSVERLARNFLMVRLLLIWIVGHTRHVAYISPLLRLIGVTRSVS